MFKKHVGNMHETKCFLTEILDYFKVKYDYVIQHVIPVYEPTIEADDDVFTEIDDSDIHFEINYDNDSQLNAICDWLDMYNQSYTVNRGEKLVDAIGLNGEDTEITICFLGLEFEGKAYFDYAVIDHMAGMPDLNEFAFTNTLAAIDKKKEFFLEATPKDSKLFYRIYDNLIAAITDTKEVLFLMDMILRFNLNSDDVDMLTSQNGVMYEKTLALKHVVKELNAMIKYENELVLDLFDNNLIYYKQTSKEIIYFYNFTERNIKCTYGDKGYSIMHPSTIFVIKVNSTTLTVESIQAYCYKKYEGKNTQLYSYPFSNMFGANTLCMGTVNRAFDNPLNAIMKVIEANYTSMNTNFRNGKHSETRAFFEYLSNNTFPYDDLSPLNYTIRKIID